jgi:hypothetical protein
MNQRSDIDRVLGIWMEDGPSAMPDRIVDVVADRISVQRQRRSWRPLRRLPMNPLVKLGAAAAAVLVVAVVGWNLLPGGSAPGAVPSPTPTSGPTPTPRPTPTPFPCDTPLCGGSLSEGDHQTAAFSPRITFTVSDPDWVNPVDDPALYQLDSAAGYILVWGKPAIAERTEACEETPAAGLGDAPADWIEFVTNHPGLEATNVHAVDLGGYSGQSADLTSRTTWTSPCAADDYFPNLVQFIVNAVPSPAGIYGVTNAAPVRLIAVDVEGQTVLFTFYGNDGRFPVSVVRAQAVIDSVRFEAP